MSSGKDLQVLGKFGHYSYDRAQGPPAGQNELALYYLSSLQLLRRIVHSIFFVLALTLVVLFMLNATVEIFYGFFHPDVNQNGASRAVGAGFVLLLLAGFGPFFLTSAFQLVSGVFAGRELLELTSLVLVFTPNPGNRCHVLNAVLQFMYSIAIDFVPIAIGIWKLYDEESLTEGVSWYIFTGGMAALFFLSIYSLCDGVLVICWNCVGCCEACYYKRGETITTDKSMGPERAQDLVTIKVEVDERVDSDLPERKPLLSRLIYYCFKTYVTHVSSYCPGTDFIVYLIFVVAVSVVWFPCSTSDRSIIIGDTPNPDCSGSWAVFAFMCFSFCMYLMLSREQFPIRLKWLLGQVQSSAPSTKRAGLITIYVIACIAWLVGLGTYFGKTSRDKKRDAFFVIFMMAEPILFCFQLGYHRYVVGEWKIVTAVASTNGDRNADAEGLKDRATKFHKYSLGLFGAIAFIAVVVITSAFSVSVGVLVCTLLVIAGLYSLLLWGGSQKVKGFPPPTFLAMLLLLLLFGGTAFLVGISFGVPEGQGNIPLAGSGVPGGYRGIDPFPICVGSYSISPSLHIVDFALMAKLAYQDEATVREDMASWFSGWSVTVPPSNSKGGVQFYVFRNGPLAVISVRGTTGNTLDIFTDADLWMEVASLQAVDLFIPIFTIFPESTITWIVSAMSSPESILQTSGHRYYSEVLDYTRAFLTVNPSITVYMTGHSLGGGVAKIVGGKLNLEVITFESPGILFSRDKYGIDKETMTHRYTTIWQDRDIVPAIDVQVGDVQSMPCPYEGFECHSMNVVLLQLMCACGDNQGRELNVDGVSKHCL